MTTTPWVPRPPHSDEPACWSWPVPSLETLDEIRARWTAENATRRSQRSLSVLKFIDPANERFHRFHDQRCAICGRQSDGTHVQDHDHVSGQVRGYLCPSCNTAEGKSVHILFAWYRLWHPAAILDHHQMYDGLGWHGGWNVYTHPQEAEEARRTYRLRPATPWDPWAQAVVSGEWIHAGGGSIDLSPGAVQSWEVGRGGE